jgi:hypothetical protein
LDIFNDSQDVMLRNDALAALQRHDRVSARESLRILAAEYPDDRSLAVLEVLLGTLEDDTDAPFPDHVAATHAMAQLVSDVEPAAVLLLGQCDATAWLAVLWKRTAQRAASLPYSALHADCHAAAFWMNASEWEAAIDATGCIESWRRIPAPLGWMAEATYRLAGIEAAWPMLAELAWLSPARFDALAGRLADASLNMLLVKFNASFDGSGDTSDLAWFPAWALVEKRPVSRDGSPRRNPRDTSRPSGRCASSSTC